MKLHDNSRFGRVIVIPPTAANLLKSHGLIDVSRGLIGLPNLQEDGPTDSRQKGCQQRPRHSLAAPFGGHRQVEDFGFTLRDPAGYQESGDVPAANRYLEVVRGVIGDGPTGCFGAGVLNRRDCLEIGRLPAANSCHIVFIMHALLPLFFLLAQPFWETKPPEQWSGQEIEILRHNSPWAQVIGPDPGVLVYLATAAPIEEAEGELRLRAKNALREPDPDYLTYLSENRDKHFVLAIPYDKVRANGKAAESRKMEEESVMVIGRKTYKMIGHFPPTPSDPVLRIVFSREVVPGDKKVVFRLYVPGVDFPEREAEFQVKDLMYHGKLEM